MSTRDIVLLLQACAAPIWKFRPSNRSHWSVLTFPHTLTHAVFYLQAYPNICARNLGHQGWGILMVQSMLMWQLINGCKGFFVCLFSRRGQSNDIMLNGRKLGERVHSHWLYVPFALTDLLFPKSLLEQSCDCEQNSDTNCGRRISPPCSPWV